MALTKKRQVPAATSFVCNLSPVDGGEELVLFDLLSVSRRTQSLLRISVQQEKNDLAGIVRHGVRNL